MLSLCSEQNARHLRALVEIIKGELFVYPIAETDEEAAEICDALKALRTEGAET